jgi:hypothetical protein
MQQAAVQRLLSLGVGKFDIEHAAMRFNHSQAVEFAGGVAVGDGAEVAPVDLTLEPGWGFEADEGLLGFGALAYVAEVIPYDGDAALEALLLKALTDHHG